MGMIMTNSDGVAECSVRARFDDLRRRINGCQESSIPGGQHWDKPLGYWAWAGDRRLPYALLDRSVREVLQSSFQDLSRTPGIGKKKMASLVVLLERAAQHEAAQPLSSTPSPEPRQDERTSPEPFRLETVSESHWEQWREVVRRHQLAQSPLGRFAPTLQMLPSVVWKSPLATYLDTTLSEMRSMKAHGEKRVRGVVEVFYYLHRALGPTMPVRHLTAVLRPAFIMGIEQWVLENVSRSEPPDLQELRQNVALPLLNQIELDGGEVIGRLAAGRLAIESAPESVIEQAERLRVTRARIYQLLEVCAEIMGVRWPEGRLQLAIIAKLLESIGSSDPRREMVRTLESLLFPQKIRPLPPVVGDTTLLASTAPSTPTSMEEPSDPATLCDAQSES